MAIDNARLPVGVEIGAQGGPNFKTTILEAASGDEQRIPEWDICRGEWDVGYGINSKTDLLRVVGFFRAVLGKAYAWRFKDWSDFEATDETFGTGNGSTTDFQLKKTYSSYQDDNTTVVRSYVRNIYVPLASPLTIKDNGSTVNPSNYDLETGGIISFDTAPVNGHTLTWTGEFDVPVRFDVDKINTAMVQDDFGSIRGIRIVEVLDSVV
jgi:uncharacterized protein (TIGR02217 family)